jgi:glycosyltransferase involved in cell wall biosynthesis
MINILLVPINDLKSHPTATRFISMGKSLVDRFDVNIFALRYKRIPTLSKANRELNFQVVDFNDIRTGSIGSYYVANTLPIFSALSRVLEKKRIDVIIHANIIPSTIAIGLGKIFHIPIIFDYQDHFPESAAVYFNSNLARSLVHSTIYRLNKINIGCSNAIVTVTNSHKELIKKYYPHKMVEVIPNGVDTDLFRPIPKAEALKELGMQKFSRKILLTYSGSIDSWLDFSIVFKAVKRLADAGFDVVLLMIGYSHSKYYLEDVKKDAKDIGIGNRVYFLDPVPQNRLVYYINASDVTLAPFRSLLMSQAVPLKILESLACGIPVCATGMAEIVQRFKDVVSIYSTEEELEYALLEHVRQKQVSADEMSKLVKEYSWDNFASSYYDLIRRIIKKQEYKTS